MKSIIILAATVACAYSYALVSLPSNYKEKYPDAFTNGRQPRDLTSALKQTKESDHLTTEKAKETDATTEKDDDKNGADEYNADEKDETKTTKAMPRHPVELTPKQVELKVSGPNVSTDHPKLVTDATTQKDATETTTETVETTPTIVSEDESEDN